MTNKIPLPGTPVRGSASGSPIMALFDLLGRRWAMGVLWQLAENRAPCTFRELQSLCEMISPGVLNARLKELRSADLVEKTDGGYAVTKMGQEVYNALLPLSAVSKQWAHALKENY